jgi:hypothetical protein
MYNKIRKDLHKGCKMKQVGKIYNKIPYMVRDINSQYKNISFLENVLEKYFINDAIKKENIINVFSNNRDNLLHFHLIINTSIKKEHVCIELENSQIEFTIEEYKESKTKTNYINSFMFIETFKHLNEKKLVTVFDDAIGCDGKKLFICTAKDELKLFQPSSKHYYYRKILEEKREIVENIAQSFNIDSEELYKELNPNVIKQTCKDLNLTYKKLSYELGYKPDTINKAASTGKISDQLQKAIELYLENLRLKEELKDLNSIKQTLKNVMI